MFIEKAQLEKLLLTDPFDIDSRLQLGRLYEREGAYSQALVQYRIILKQNPENHEALVGQQNCQLLSEESFADKPKPLALSVVAPAADVKAEVVPLSSRTKLGEKVRFSDIVGMSDLKDTLRLKVIEPFKNPGLFARFAKRKNDGILLYGPPGCGKTMIAKAIAHECDVNFISIDISEILNMYVGGSESNLAQVFERARASRPCVLFFDELDAIAISRSKVQAHHTHTLVNELLIQMDGLGKDNENILILGATNRPWDIDSAAKRPGRFSRLVFVPPLDLEARRELFRLRLFSIPCDSLDLDRLADKTRGFSGADIDGLIEIAKERAMIDIIRNKFERGLTMDDLMSCMDELEPSCEDWMKTAENLLKFGGAGAGYKDLARYMRSRI